MQNVVYRCDSLSQPIDQEETKKIRKREMISETISETIRWTLAIYSIDSGNKSRGKSLWTPMVIDEINRFLAKEKLFCQKNALSGGDLALFTEEKPLGEDDFVFFTEEKGKPYVKINSLENKEINFNISHSNGLLAILISNRPCGVDIQKSVEAKYSKIAKRIFDEEEQRKIELEGADAFFRLWTRKEAVAKATGEGLFGKEKTNQKVLIEEIDLNIPGYEDFYLALGFVVE